MYDKVLEDNKQKSEELAKNQSRISSAVSKIGEAKTAEELDLNLAEMRFEDINENTQKFQQNLAKNIFELSDLTNNIGGEISKIKESTLSEKFIGVFSKQKAAELRNERISNASIEEQLQEVVTNANNILNLLTRDLVVLKDQSDVLANGQKKVLDEKAVSVDKLAAVEDQLNVLNPEIQSLNDKIAISEDPKERAALEQERHAKQEQANELVIEQRTQTALIQSYERYTEQFKRAIDANNSQRANQKVLIDKLQEDTKNRQVAYDNFIKSIKVSEQQQTAHKINSIGVKTDQLVDANLTQIKAASENQMIDMLETHKGHMKLSREIQAQADAADKKFLERFGTVVEEVKKAHY